MPLAGGNSGPVFRRGDTVRRPAGQWTPQVQALMRGLRDRGVTTVPEPLGVDDEGREIVQFVDGDVITHPLPPWLWADALLVDVAAALRAIHDAAATLQLPVDGWRRAAVLPAETLCHGDAAWYNAVFREGRLAAFIDWDYAIPAPRGWDLGYAAYRWVPLTPQGREDGNGPDLPEQRRRLRLFCETYGDISPEEVQRWAIVRLDDLIAFTKAQVLAGDANFIRTTEEGHLATYEGDVAWLRRTYPASPSPAVRRTS